MNQTITQHNDRSAVIYWITSWRLLIIFTAVSSFSHVHADGSEDVTHIAVLCVGMMTAVFGVTTYRLWPKLGALFFIGTLAAHFGHTDFTTGLASVNANDVLTGFIADSRMAIFEIVLAASVTFVGKSMMRVKHGPDGYIDTFDISLILTRRFLFAVLILPIITIALLKAASFFMGDFRWQNPVLLGELRDYTIGIIAFAPLGIGIAIYMTGGPWLEPRLQPVRRYVTLFDEIILSGTIIEDISNDRRMQDRVAPIVDLLRKFDIKLAAANLKTQAQLQTVAGLGIGHCSGNIFANAVSAHEYPSLVQTFEIETLVADTNNIVSFRDFSGH